MKKTSAMAPRPLESSAARPPQASSLSVLEEVELESDSLHQTLSPGALVDPNKDSSIDVVGQHRTISVSGALVKEGIVDFHDIFPQQQEAVKTLSSSYRSSRSSVILGSSSGDLDDEDGEGSTSIYDTTHPSTHMSRRSSVESSLELPSLTSIGLDSSANFEDDNKLMDSITITMITSLQDSGCSHESSFGLLSVNMVYQPQREPHEDSPNDTSRWPQETKFVLLDDTNMVVLAAPAPSETLDCLNPTVNHPPRWRKEQQRWEAEQNEAESCGSSASKEQQLTRRSSEEKASQAPLLPLVVGRNAGQVKQRSKDRVPCAPRRRGSSQESIVSRDMLEAALSE
jgi:hypothetical protein